VDDAAGMRECDRLADVDESSQQRSPTPPWPRLRNDLGERRAGQAFHHEESATVVIRPDVVDRHDRGVLEPALHARFPTKPRDYFAR
jgi:hypothetical protein